MVESRASKIRAMLSSPVVSVGVGAGDALTAKLIERAGFDFVWSSGFCISASYAVPDASLISMAQFLEVARSINDVISIPVIADCDTGFGNVNNVVYAVRKFEQAGVAGICLEDKVFPKDTSLLKRGRQELAPIGEFVGKIQAAKDTQSSADFVVVARVEALIAGLGHEEALKRALQYADAGADCILIHSKSNQPDEILEFIKAWDCSVPLVLVPTAYPSLTEEAIAELGKAKLVIYANHPLRAAVKAQEIVLEEIRRVNGIHTIDGVISPVDHIFELQGVPEMKEYERRYLR